VARPGEARAIRRLQAGRSAANLWHVPDAFGVDEADGASAVELSVQRSTARTASIVPVSRRTAAAAPRR
jgi:hypothetical protein